MYYVTSDLHGYSLDAFMRLLEKVAFSAEDTLYVLGDVIDRRDGGPKLLSWISKQPNVRFLLGNHEAMMLACESFIDGTPSDDPRNRSYTLRNTLDTWERNGGDATRYALESMKPEEVRELLAYLKTVPLYEEITVGTRRFLLVHSGLDNFDADKPLDEYTERELLWTRPSPQTRYFEDRTVVFGHTPTMLYSCAKPGRPLITDTWINIDVGAGKGLPPLLYCLDNGREFYGE